MDLSSRIPRPISPLSMRFLVDGCGIRAHERSIATPFWDTATAGIRDRGGEDIFLTWQRIQGRGLYGSRRVAEGVSQRRCRRGGLGVLAPMAARVSHGRPVARFAGQWVACNFQLAISHPTPKALRRQSQPFLCSPFQLVATHGIRSFNLTLHSVQSKTLNGYRPKRAYSCVCGELLRGRGPAKRQQDQPGRDSHPGIDQPAAPLDKSPTPATLLDRGSRGLWRPRDLWRREPF